MRFLALVVMQIHEQNSSLAKESKVLEIGLDRVYSFSAGNSDQDTEGLAFRFMPDAEEVQQALQVKIICTFTNLLVSCLKSVTSVQVYLYSAAAACTNLHR